MIKYSVKGGDKVESLKINYIMYSTGRTGGSRGLMNLMNELVKLGHEISITVLHYDSWFPLSPDIRIITKKTKLDLYYFYGVQKISKRNTILRHIFFINKLMSIVPRVDVNAATFSPTAYIASWKSMDGSTPFYHMQHFETIFFGDPVMKKFVYDSYFLPIYKIANSIWLREKLFEITGTRYPIVNTAVEHDIFYKRDTNGIKKNEDGNRIDIVALGKGGWKKATSIYKAVSKVRALEKDREIVLHYFGHTTHLKTFLLTERGRYFLKIQAMTSLQPCTQIQTYRSHFLTPRVFLCPRLRQWRAVVQSLQLLLEQKTMPWMERLLS